MILGGIWAIFCPKPCAWAVLVSAQVVLGVGFAAVYFAACCPPLLFIGLSLVGAGLGLFTAWARICQRSTCDVLQEVALTLVSVVLPLLAWMKFVFPPLALCDNPLLTAVLSSIVAAIGAWALACKART